MVQDWYRDGIPIWWDESERIVFTAQSRVSKSRAAVERAQEASTKGNKKAVPGRYYVAEPAVNDGGDWPTRDEWLEEQANKNKNAAPVTKFGTTAKGGSVVQGRK
jgi:hypothetical protein